MSGAPPLSVAGGWGGGLRGTCSADTIKNDLERKYTVHISCFICRTGYDPFAGFSSRIRHIAIYCIYVITMNCRSIRSALAGICGGCE